ncbi:MAG: hypothetical protein K1X72_15855 [Pyrinomonadaceae bacterium]|nr:hypothetical protein [Pyrinomonadaceae bacterium]
MFRNTTLWIVVLLSAISLSMACGGQLEEGNKLVNEANAAIDKAKAADAKINSISKELLGDGWVNAEDNAKYFADNKAKVDELLGLDEQNAKLMNEAAGKFEQASKMNLESKFKEYLGLKAQEFKKRADKYSAEASFLKSVSVEKDNENAGKLGQEFTKKNADLIKEANDLGEKAEKIAKDNPTLFK